MNLHSIFQYAIFDLISNCIKITQNGVNSLAININMQVIFSLRLNLNLNNLTKCKNEICVIISYSSIYDEFSVNNSNIIIYFY